MITLSQPIVKDQVLVGVISIDVLLSRLEQLLRESTQVLAPCFWSTSISRSRQQQSGGRLRPKAVNGAGWLPLAAGAFQFQYAIPDTELTLLHRIPLSPCCGPCSASPPRP